MASPTRANIEQALKSEAAIEERAAQIAKDIAHGDYSIVDFVEQLGFALTSTDLSERVAATTLLSSVLAALPSRTLNAKHLEVLMRFYVGKLADSHNLLPPILAGIAALVDKAGTELTLDDVEQFLEAFYGVTTCQQQVATDRVKIYNIVEYLTVHLSAAPSAKQLQLIIATIDGECDPQRLDKIFSFMPAFLRRVKLNTKSEDMFDIFAVYFPLDYTPAKHVPAHITRDSLAAKLADCLVASVEFSNELIELALEKLDSDLTVAKLDSIQLLELIANRLPPQTHAKHFSKIWRELQTQFLLSKNDERIVSGALSALSAYLSAASAEPDISHSYQTEVLIFVLQHLSDVNSMHFGRATQLALACISADASFAANRLLPLLLNARPDEHAHSKLYKVLALLLERIASSAQLEAIESPLAQQIVDDALATLDSNLKQKNGDLQQTALAVLTQLAPILDDERRALLYKLLMQLILHNAAGLEALVERLGAVHAQELRTHFIEACMRNFQIFADPVKQAVYSVFIVLSKQPDFRDCIVEFVVEHAFDLKLNDQERLLALRALNTYLNGAERAYYEAAYRGGLLQRLFVLARQRPAALDELALASAAISVIVRNLDVAAQQEIISTQLPKLDLQMAADLYIAQGLLGFLHVDVSLTAHFEQLMQDLVQLSLTAEATYLREIANNLLASLINKAPSQSSNHSVLNAVIANLKQAIHAGEERAVTTLAWLAKGLTVSGHESAAEIVEALADLLDHPNLQHAAVLAFDIICAEYPQLQLHLPIVKFLYKQKFFHLVFKTLEHKLASFALHHLNAFVYVLKATPHAVLKINIERVGPVVLQCLESSSEQTVLIAVDICAAFVKQQDAYFAQRLVQLINACIALTQRKPAMHVRRNALDLLYEVTKYPTYLLLPHKVDTCLELAKCLDDPKRLVRQSAVRTRNAWCLVGAPGEQ